MLRDFIQNLIDENNILRFLGGLGVLIFSLYYTYSAATGSDFAMKRRGGLILTPIIGKLATQIILVALGIFIAIGSLLMMASAF